LLAGAGFASAKTLVYCSEGSPENFTPAINTAGTNFDAARPVYNRLTEFKRGTTEVDPGLAESCEVTDGGKHLSFAQGRQVPSGEGLQAPRATSTPTMCSGRSIASGSRIILAPSPWRLMMRP
jgi:dipeptide transport system substrate-binding protein